MGGRAGRARLQGPGSLAGVLMEVTAATADPSGGGGSERSTPELWKLVIRWRNFSQLHVEYAVNGRNCRICGCGSVMGLDGWRRRAKTN